MINLLAGQGAGLLLLSSIISFILLYISQRIVFEDDGTLKTTAFQWVILLIMNIVVYGVLWSGYMSLAG